VRDTIKFPLVALAFAGLAACGDARATEASQEDLQRDLQLASSTTMNLGAPQVNPALLTMETRPEAAPKAANVVKKAPGPRAVRSQAPTVEAAPDVDVAALEEVDEVMSESIAPAPEEITEPVAVAPRPAPPAGDYGTGINGGGEGVYGGGTGVVIRGGGVDGDNCELHRRGRGGISRGPTYGGPVFIPAPRAPNTGGIFIGARNPGERIARGTPSAPSTRGTEARSIPRSTESRAMPSRVGVIRSRIGR
jgi:hypothetical protein